MRYLGGGCTNVLRELPELADRLEARYPGVRVLEAYISRRFDNGEQTQHLKYRAPLEILRAHGLVRDSMLERKEKCGATEIGDYFTLRDGDPELYHDEKRGLWNLIVLTGTSPTYWRHSPETKKLQRIAAKLLRPFLTPAASSLRGK